MDAFFDKFASIPLIQKAGGMALVLLLIVVGFYFLVLGPEKEVQTTLVRSIASKEHNLAEKRKMVGDLSQYKREVEKLNQDLIRALKLLPNKSEIPTLLQKISSLAKKSGLLITSFTPKPEVAQDFYAKVPVGLKLNGTYNEITSFFDSVSKLSRIVNVGRFTFKLASKNKKSGSMKKTLSAECTATTFRFIAKPAARPKKGKQAKKKGH